MAQPILVQQGWNRMVQDAPRDQLPGDAVWNMVDWIPNFSRSSPFQMMPVSPRNGWRYFDSTLGAATSIVAIWFGDVAAGLNHRVVITNDAHLWDSGVDRGVITVAAGNPKQLALFNGFLIIPPGPGATPPLKYDGSVVVNLLGTPPTGVSFVDSYKGRLLAATTTKLYFSAVGNQDSWDTTNAWIAPTYPLVALASLTGAILLFSKQKTERIRGDSPPPALGMVLEPLFDVGCIDPRSIAKYQDRVIFADTSGVYMTDGASLEDLTKEGGIKTYWDSMMNGYSSTTWTVAGTYINGKYIVSVMNGSTIKDCLVCDVATKSWYRFSNIPASCFAQSLGFTRDLYFGMGNQGRTGDLAVALRQSGTLQDGDLSNILPVIETGYFRPRPYSRATRYLPPGTSKRIRRVYLTADLRAVTGQTVSLAASYLTDPQASSYISLGSIPYIDQASAGVGMRRTRLDINKEAQGIAFKLAATGGETFFAGLYDLELEYRFREASRAN